MNGEKDEKLNNLFKDYVDEEQSPSESVTAKAIEFMRKEPQTEKVPALVPAMETPGGNGDVGRIGRKNYIAAIALIFLVLALCAVLICYATIKSAPTAVDSLKSSESITRNQLEEITDNTSLSASDDKPFLPFVPREAVTEYKEYALKVNKGNYNAGETVLYYVEYAVNGNRAKLYVEAEDIFFDELAFYKKYENTQTYNELTFWYGTDENASVSYVYFQADSYGYNLELKTSDRSALFNVLTAITENFKKK